MAGLDILEDEDDGFADDTYDRAPIGPRQPSPGSTSSWRGQLSKELEGNEKAINRFYAPRVKAYDDMAAAIRARRAGPTRAEQLFAISAALAAPTKYSGLGAAFSNLSPALAAMEGQKRIEGLENEDLATKYKMGAMGKEEEGFNAVQDNRAKLLAIEARYANQRQPASPQIVQVAERLYPTDKAKQNEYIVRNSPAAVKGIFAPKAPKAAAPGLGFTPPWQLFGGN